jgi:hypothetical protein
VAEKITSVPGYSVDELKNWSLLGEFRSVLDKIDPTPARPRPKGGPERLLTEEDYLCSVLFAMFNPVIDSMRGLCACSHLDRVQEEVCSRPVSLASFSEAQHVFGSARLEKVFAQLVAEQPRRRASAAKGLAPPPKLSLVDSSVFPAVTRMAWAQWRYQNKTQRAVRLHLQFSLFEGEPSKTTITEGRRCERAAFAEAIEPGGFYVGDRNYGHDYGLLAKIEEIGARYVARLYENAVTTTLEEMAVDSEDRAAGVVYDRIVRLGSSQLYSHGPVRVLCIEREGMDEPVILVTNCLDRESFSAALLAEIYRQRWQIELFFRWLKCIMGRPNQWHWLAESPEGVAIQIYSTLIAALLLARRLGKLPNKRSMELLRFHSMGMVSAENLGGLLAGQLAKKSK